MTLALIFAAFVITYTEVGILARQQLAVTSFQRVAAANWAVALELVLCLDIWLLVHHWWLIPPILVGAWVGMYANVPTGGSK
jgi:hypothetical protein